MTSIARVHAVETRKLTKFYGRSPGILNLDLTVEEGEVFGFIGPNGAGKSTTIRALLGLIFPTSGSGRIFGLDIVSRSRDIKRQVGYVPAEAGFYHKMRVLEFLRHAAGFYSGRLEGRIRELAEALDLELDRRIADLSRGNQRKVMIVQAFVHRPRLLILDEPTVGLDPLVQARFFDLLGAENRRGATVFLSSHTLSDVQKTCRRIGIIRSGRLAAVEDIETLRKKQLRRVRVEFSKDAGPGALAVEGMIAPRREADALSFMYSGSMPSLVGALAGRPVADLIIEEPTLEEIFMHYYAGSAGPEEGQASGGGP